jgi:uncharacterized protein YeeX (DUF496 family)
MMRRYVKKPIEIEAVQWTGDNRREIFDFCTLSYFNTDFETGNLKLNIQTLEGNMEASVGDYIIKGIKGEFYPCKPDIFLLTYDEVTI